VKADGTRQGTRKSAHCEHGRAGLEIDGRTTQAGQPGGILHGVCPVANESPQDIVRLRHCAAQHKISTRLKYLCEQVLKIDKTGRFSPFLASFLRIKPWRLNCADIPAPVD
ncbi:hypothetical protein, partial [Mesorhizobium sp. M7A.F.Ca.CA.002.05.1.1]|uniref:hypothetical protein n=1 Tax=Mesorhizobium sp. M7A.F.Ca.CA.002.05.1.1 TaxID=2496704 RepID=UPI0019D133F7